MSDPSARRRKPVQYERHLQHGLVEFHATMVVDPLSAILFAVPNGELRDKATAGMLSGRRRRQTKPDVPGAISLPPLTDAEMMRPGGQGVIPGAPDLVLLVPGKMLLIEIKIPKTIRHAAGRQSVEQQTFERAARALGFDYRVVTSIEQYQAILVEHGVKLRIHSIFPVIHLPPPVRKTRRKPAAPAQPTIGDARR